jgi:hypothetical protein
MTSGTVFWAPVCDDDTSLLSFEVSVVKAFLFGMGYFIHGFPTFFFNCGIFLSREQQE